MDESDQSSYVLRRMFRDHPYTLVSIAQHLLSGVYTMDHNLNGPCYLSFEERTRHGNIEFNLI
jgi:hypothetical protein